MHQFISIIPARGGSKGIPGKNLRCLAGKPLIAHSIQHSQQAQLVRRTYVTTDDPEIALASHRYGAKIIHRPPELADDSATSESALIHALDVLETNKIYPELLVFLQCTSPLRSSNDIDLAIQQLRMEEADSLLSVSPSHRFLWHHVDGVAESINYDYRHRLRRQCMIPQYVENGSIYIFKPWVLRETGNRLGGKISLFVMPEEKNWEIDTLTDFEYVEFLLEKSKNE